MGRLTQPTVKTASGWRTVTYRDAQGNTQDALIMGGTGDSLNLRLLSERRDVTGIARGTTPKATNVWF